MNTLLSFDSVLTMCLLLFLSILHKGFTLLFLPYNAVSVLPADVQIRTAERYTQTAKKKLTGSLLCTLTVIGGYFAASWLCRQLYQSGMEKEQLTVLMMSVMTGWALCDILIQWLVIRKTQIYQRFLPETADCEGYGLYTPKPLNVLFRLAVPAVFAWYAAKLTYEGKLPALMSNLIVFTMVPFLFHMRSFGGNGGKTGRSPRMRGEPAVLADCWEYDAIERGSTGRLGVSNIRPTKVYIGVFRLKDGEEIQLRTNGSLAEYLGESGILVRNGKEAEMFYPDSEADS